MPKITEEEQKKISELKHKSLSVASSLGELTYQKIIIEDQIAQQKEKIFEIREDESILFEQLREKYGNVTINIETGEFN